MTQVITKFPKISQLITLQISTLLKFKFKHRLDSGRYCIVARHAKDHEINAARHIAEKLGNPDIRTQSISGNLSKLALFEGVCHFKRKFQTERGVAHQRLFVSENWTDYLVLSQSTRVTDGRTVRRADRQNYDYDS